MTSESERPTKLYELYARDSATDRQLFEPHEVLAKSPFEAILKAQKFFGMFTDVRRMRIDVNEIAVLTV